MFDSNVWAKTGCHMLIEIPVSANTVPMVRKTEPITQKFENPLKFFVVEERKVGEILKKVATQEALLQSRSKFFQNALRDGKKVSFREHVCRSWESLFLLEVV